MRRNVIVDTDLSLGVPGAEIDDGAAIIAMARNPGVDIEAITTCFGNVTSRSAAICVARLTDLLNLETPIHRGADAPLESSARFSPPWEPDVTLSGGSPDRSAAKAIVEASRRSPGLAIVALAPLTNIALALRMDPTIVERIDHLYIMGGSRDTNDEFNFSADPTSTEEVLRAGIPTTLFSLDVTNQATFTASWFRSLPADDPALRLLADHAPAWIETVGERGWHRGGCALHDALPATYLTHPDIARVEAPPDTRLRSWGLPTEGTCRIAVELDADAFVQRLTGLLTSNPT